MERECRGCQPQLRVVRSLGGLGFARAIRVAAFTTTNFLGSFTKVSGAHTFTFGGQYSRYNGGARIVPSAGR